MHCFPIVSRHHLNCIPRTAVEERAIGSFANTLLTPDAEIRINFNATEGRMIFIRDPKHARLDRAVFDARRGAGATRATVCRDCEDTRSLFASRFSVTLRHGPVLFYDVEHDLMGSVLQEWRAKVKTRLL